MNTEASFQTPEFTYSISELKGNKEYFIEGFISTTDPDDVNDVITENGQNKLLSEIKGKNITLDIGHSEWVDDSGRQHGDMKPKSNIIPVAKIVEAERRDNGTWVKAKLNSNLGRFNEIWGSIKDGFLHSFSIAMLNLKAVTRDVGGKMMRFIDDFNLANITLTGVPINRTAAFRPVLKALLAKNIKSGENNMTNNDKPVVPAPVANPVTPPAKPAEAKPAATPPVADPVNPAPDAGNAPAAPNAGQATGRNSPLDTAIATPPVDPAVPAAPVDDKAVIAELQKKQEAQTKDIADMNTQLATAETAKKEYEAKIAELTPAGTPAVTLGGLPIAPGTPAATSPLGLIKSRIETNDQQIALLKAKLAEPVLKSFIHKPDEQIINNQGPMSLIDKIA